MERLHRRGLIGGLGVIVHLALLTLLFKTGAADFITSQLIATVVAMVFNFAINNLITYRDRQLKGGRWLRGLEPRVRNHLGNSPFAHLQPWLERRALFRFQRQPLARGVAAGMFCGLIPGPLQIPGTLLVCAWLRGNIVAGGVATFYTNPLTTVPLYALAFYVGALVMPGTQTLPAWSSVVPGGDFSVQALGAWMQALGTPLLVGLPTLGLVMAVLGYATVQLLWLAPALQRKRRLARSR